ncbi:MAG: hypothetical protein FJ317_08575 [SAR202 cluster bacterium]|nr:hypothetical protein [SAR202 cluster bacterium]
MVEAREDLLRHYRTMRDAMLAAIEGLSDEQMSEPSIDGWSVNDHLAHIALWDDIRADEVVRISAGQATAWPMTGEQDAQFNALAYDLRRKFTAAQARWEWERSRARLLDAIRAATPRGLDASLYGEAPIRSSHETQHADWIQRWRSERGL